MEAKFDSTNNEQRAAYRMIERTNNSFFLAGRAGTGKTTFLKNVQEGIKKKFVVLAPTGRHQRWRADHPFLLRVRLRGSRSRGNRKYEPVQDRSGP